VGKKEKAKPSDKQESSLFIKLVYLGLAIVVILSILLWFDVFEGTAQYSFYEFGNINAAGAAPGNSDYEMSVNLSTKGVFVAGRKIDVSIELKAMRMADELKQTEFLVTFPGSTPFPIPKGLPEGLAKVLSGGVTLNWSSNESSAHGEGAILYQTPQMSGVSVIAPFASPGQYTYNLMIGYTTQTADRFIRFGSYIYIAPPEIRLQERDNKFILILTVWAVYFALAQTGSLLARRKKASAGPAGQAEPAVEPPKKSQRK
jgi:hypothetical protein